MTVSVDQEQLAQFLEGVHRDVRALAEAQSTSSDESVFTEYMIEALQEFAELDEVAACHYEARGVKASGYGFSEDGTTLDLLVTECTWKDPPAVVGQARVVDATKRAKAFFSQAVGRLPQRMEESAPAFDMALQIHQMQDSITRVRVFVLTDGIAKRTPMPDEELNGVHFTFHVWDAERLFRCQTSGKKREPIIINFDTFGGPIPVLSCAPNPIYSAYLAIIPGAVLSALYERWGARLLESNVRTFLQARGKVNRGVRETIRDAPEMFFTYNNGISTTAERAELVDIGSGLKGIRSLEDFQIVNGGQTTASLFNTFWKDKADLSTVSVAMKLTVVNKPDTMDAVVRDISRYSNTQNNVTTADFESNDPFHKRVEDLSRTIWAPDPLGAKDQTRWYYERARGQYNDERTRQGTRARIQAWEAVHPSRQKFTKTDLAKFENAWQQLPHLVCLGAQKDFAHFSAKLKEARSPEPDEAAFRAIVGKAILFRTADRIIDELQLGGYKAQVTAYTVASVSYATGQRIDLAKVWQEQALPTPLADEVRARAKPIYDFISKPPGGRNVTEWCKDVECWEGVKQLPLELSEGLQKELLSSSGGQRALIEESEAVSAERRALIDKASAIPAAVWLEMSSWAKQTGNLQPWQRGVVYTVGKFLSGARPISWKQANHALQAYDVAVGKGFKPRRDPTSDS